MVWLISWDEGCVCYLSYALQVPCHLQSKPVTEFYPSHSKGGLLLSLLAYLCRLESFSHVSRAQQ